MSLPADGVNANTLSETTTIPTGKKLIFLDPDTNEGGIITLENLTKQILSNLTSQTFNLDQGNKTLLAALNELNSKTFPTRLTDAFQDTLQTGISIATYVPQTANAPSEYGIILYLAHNKDSNKWYIAIAFGTATNEAFISRKINSGPWSNWEKISVTK